MVKSYFADIGSSIGILLDEELPDDVNVVIKVKGSDTEFHINPNRIYSTLRNKDAIIAGLNKRLVAMIDEFKTKISLKKMEGSKFRDILIRDVVYNKIKDNDHVYLREEEEIILSITRMMLYAKEQEEYTKLMEIRTLEKKQEEIDGNKEKKIKK